MPYQDESLTSFSIHPDVLLSVLDDATALVDRRRRVRTTNPRMDQLFASDDTARRIPFTYEDGHWRLGPSSRLDERLRDVMLAVEDVIVGARERCEADLGTAGGVLMAIACSIDGGRGALVRIRLRTMEEEHRARCVEVVEAMQLGLNVFRLEDEHDDRTMRCIYANPAVEILTTRKRTQFVGRLLDEISPFARKTGLLQHYLQVIAEQKTRDFEYSLTHPETKQVAYLALRSFPLSGNCVGSIFEIVTAKVEAQAALQREIALKESQAALLELVRQLSTPLLPIAEGVLVAPLVGQMDEKRGEHFLEILLEGIQRHAAKVVLIDVTGVPSIDLSVAEQLLRAARAARLLGTRTALVGITPDVARTMVELGVDTSGIETYADLRASMRAAQRAQKVFNTPQVDRPKR